MISQIKAKNSTGINVIKPFTRISAIQSGEFIFPEIDSKKFNYTDDLPGKLLLEKNNTNADSSSYLVSQFSDFGRFNISINETGLNSMSTKNGNKHNFEYKTVKNQLPLSFEDPSINKSLYESIPIRDWDTFNISPPLTEITSITLNFKSNDIPISFNEDCLYNCKSDIVNNYIKLIYDNHGLKSGDKIFIERFNSGNPILDEYVNRKDGHFVAGDPNMPSCPQNSTEPTNTEFWTDPSINVKNININSIKSLRFDVFVEKRRIRIPMKFTCSDPSYKS
jgi:hypothetical protein